MEVKSSPTTLAVQHGLFSVLRAMVTYESSKPSRKDYPVRGILVLPPEAEAPNVPDNVWAIHFDPSTGVIREHDHVVLWIQHASG